MNEQDKRNLIEKLKNKPGLRGKVDAHCISCVFDVNSPGNWRIQVGECTVTSCPLYSVRPRSETQENGQEGAL